MKRLEGDIVLPKLGPRIKELKCSVIALVERDGKFLAVSRKDNPNDFGFPGGKVEFAESLESAVVRELKEETGLECRAWADLKYAYSGIWPIKNPKYICYAFWCNVEDYETSSEEEGVIKWLDPNSLAHGGTFRAYNNLMLKHLGLVE